MGLIGDDIHTVTARMKEKLRITSYNVCYTKLLRARQTANLIAREKGFARACHGELFSVPHSDLAKWVRESEKVVVIDGCSLFCHSRIAENIISRDKLVVIDA